MTNYQLYRTNVLLGGQMKYDLIVNNKEVTNIYISPISNNTPFTYQLNDILQYSHQENIRGFYKKISSSFYKDFVSPMLTSVYPLPNDYNGAQFDTTYEMGLKKLSPVRQQVYDKTYEFFCPIWLEKLEGIENLTFRFEVYTGSNTLIITQDLQIKDDIKDYLNTYLTSLKLTEGCDWVLDVNRYNCSITGLNAETGLTTTKKLFKLYDDLTHRERPLLEFNNLIINELNKNQLITKQLFNFNFVFNPQDLLADPVYNMMAKKSDDSDPGIGVYKMTLKVLCRGQELEVVDIFTNHHFIPKMDASPKYLPEVARESKNVLDYLSDDKYVDLIYKNKISQNTCHWKLSENNLHFNTYTGFAPTYTYTDQGTTTTIDIPYVSENICDISVPKFLAHSNNCWCKTYQLASYDRLEINKLFNNSDNFSRFSTGECWVNGVKYNASHTPAGSVDVSCLVLNSDDGLQSEVNQSKLRSEWKVSQFSLNDNNGEVYIFKQDTHTVSRWVFLFTKEQSPYILHYKTLIESLSRSTDNDLSLLKNILNTAQQPLDQLVINEGLKIVNANSPDVKTNEIEYYKAPNTITLFRYFGKIKPYFIKPDNDVYFNIDWKKLKYNEVVSNNPLYKKYSATQYQPLYPSIGYFALENDTIDYTNQYGWNF